MKYKGTRLAQWLNEERGRYADLAKRMMKYRTPRKNESKNEYNLHPFLKDGHNPTLSILSALMRETALPLEFFVDLEQGEILTRQESGVTGNNNIVNSSISNDLTLKVDHLHEKVKILEDTIEDKKQIITKQESEIEYWKKRFDKLLDMKSEN